MKIYISGLYALSVMFLVGCAATPVLKNYSVIGEANPAEERAVVERFEKSEPKSPGTNQVQVLIDTIPEGIDYADGLISVHDGYDHQIIGKFEIWSFVRMGGLLTREDAIESTKRLASAAGGDLVIASYLNPQGDRVYNRNERTGGIVGWVLNIDPKLKGKKIKAKSQPISTRK